MSYSGDANFTSGTSPVLTQTVNQAQNNGGGSIGGGGGSIILNLNIKGFASSEPLKTNSDGIIQEAAKIKSADGAFTLDIAKGTKVLTKLLTPVVNISVEPLVSPPTAPFLNAFVAAYTFGPDGTTFDPPLTFTFTYSSLPANMDENTLTVVYYNGTSWETVPGKLDKDAKTITAQISHFSIYAVVGRVNENAAPAPTPTLVSTPTPANTPTPTPAPTPTPTPSPTVNATPASQVTTTLPPASASPTVTISTSVTPSNTPEEGKHFNWWIVIGIILGVIIIFTLAIALVIRRFNVR